MGFVDNAKHCFQNHVTQAPDTERVIWINDDINFAQSRPGCLLRFD